MIEDDRDMPMGLMSAFFDEREKHADPVVKIVATVMVRHL